MLTFLLTLDNPALHRNILGSFDYNFSHVEFNIRDEASVSGDYKASDWLTFVPLQTKDNKPKALAGTDPGGIDVPIPLRLFPDSPIIMGQLADQSVKKEVSSVGELSLWEYNFIYSHEHAEAGLRRDYC